MIIEKLYLKDFRNYQHLQLDFHPDINLFVGDNAQGKTNIIEAIYMSAIGKSYRTNKDNELIRWNQPVYQLKTSLKEQQRSILIELNYAQNGIKQLKINGVTKKRLVELIGNLRVVIFTPEDLMLVKSGPSLRRKFMDSNISQVSPKYLHSLQQYVKVLEQKNNLLRAIKKGQQTDELLLVWNEQLAHYAATITKKRYEFVERINLKASQIHSIISADSERLEIGYKSGSNLKLDDLASSDVKALEQSIYVNMESSLKEECSKGFAIVGPHRDDLNIKINELEARTFGSQGQQRTSVLSLKLAEVDYIKDESGTFPVLLLDDVMSELDHKRRNFLLASVLNKVQMFITTTDLEHVNDDILSSCRVFAVSRGCVTPTGG